MFKRICIPVADDDTGQHVMQWGFEFARKLGASVVVTHAVQSKLPEVRAEPRDTTPSLATKSPLEPWVQHGAQMDVPTVALWSYGSDTAEAICAVAKDQSADLIFMPTHAREGMRRVLLGSVAERVTRLSMIPVMLIRIDTPAQGLRFEKIVVPVDGSDTAELALCSASQLAKQLQASLTLVHVIEDLPSQYYAMDATLSDRTVREFEAALEARARGITARAAEACDPAPIESRILHTYGYSVAQTINRVADTIDADLIVLGTHGRTGVKRLLLGSVAESVAHHANVPVLLVSPLQRSELWQPRVLEVLAKEVLKERARKFRTSVSAG